MYEYILSVLIPIMFAHAAHETLTLNSSPPGQNGGHFTDDIFKCIFANEKFYILIKISLNFVPKCPIDNIPAVL